MSDCETAIGAQAIRRQQIQTVFFMSADAAAICSRPDLQGMPFIINEDGVEELEFNEYLLARRNGDWQGCNEPGGIVAEASGVQVKRADLKYLRQRAYQLDQYRRWSKIVGIDHLHVQDDGLERFMKALELTPVPGRTRGRKPTTVNQSLGAILDALHYSAACGYRDKLRLNMKNTTGGEVAPLLFRAEDGEEIRTWYRERDVKQTLDVLDTAACQLAGVLMYRLGLRIEETLGLPRDAIPDPEQFRRDRSARFFRIKGKRGKSRTVWLDEDVCKSVQTYRNFHRHLRGACSSSDEELLLLGPKPDGSVGRISSRYFQKAFARARIASGATDLWPHGLRHHWAAHTLLRSWARKTSFGSTKGISFDIPVAQNLLSADLLFIKEQLGHVRIETTIGYLKAVSALLKSEEYEAYSAALEEE